VSDSSRVTQGMRGGFLAAGTVAGFFFVSDLLHLAPLATPTALGHAVLGPWAVAIDFPIVAQVANGALVGGKLLTLTGIHFLTFGLLGIGAVAVFDRYQVPLNIVSGSVFGLVAYSTMFAIGMAMAGSDVLTGLPGIGSVAAANLLGGGVMGGYMQMCE
jgi:hypothetical protein